MATTVTVDIWRKCNSTCRCPGTKGSHVTAKAGDVDSNFGYCTHSLYRDSTIKQAKWKGHELERTDGILHAFEDIESITTYYYSKRDGLLGVIDNPLVLRVKKSPDKAYWFENAGHYLNTKWTRISREESTDYPRGDHYKKDEFEERLKSLSCIIYGLHGIYIDGVSGYNFDCDLCGKELKVAIKHDDLIYKSTKYNKYTYEGIIDDTVLIHSDRKLAFKKQRIGFQSYYIPLQLDSNVQSISSYYWEGDGTRRNPLLIEIKLRGNRCLWLENTGVPEGKHDKWKFVNPKQPNGQLSEDANLQNRLDVLNCIFNKTVQITIGAKGCHHPNYATPHKTRIISSYKEVWHYPLIYSYEYKPTVEVNNKPFNVSGMFVEDNKQELDGKTLQFTKIKKLVAYVSHCDKNKPFLIYLERENQDNKWYGRKDNNGSWEEYVSFGKESPDQVKGRIDAVFTNFKVKLNINGCLVSSEEIKLDIREMSEKGNDTKVYTYKGTSIILSKIKNNPVHGFFNNLHKSAKFPFRLKKELGGDHKLGGVSSSGLPNVKDVHAYFWEGNTNRPIILEIQVVGEATPRYYSRSNGQKTSWMHNMNKNKNIIHLLDHYNCENNKAIPIDLKDPVNLSKFHPYTSPICIGHTRKVTANQKIPIKKDDNYEVYQFSITGDTKISRLTYNTQDTNIIPPYTTPISHLRIYKWKGSEAPLMVEFQSSPGKSTWYENISKDLSHTQWKEIDEKVSREFYNSEEVDPQQPLTEKLDELNCFINRVVQIQLENKGDPRTYCHKDHRKKIIVYLTSNKSTIDGFDGYEHIPTDRFNFHISSFKNDNTRQIFVKSDNLRYTEDLLNVNKVIVYFSSCEPEKGPLLFYIGYSNGKNNKWFRRMSRDGFWTEAVKLANQTPEKASQDNLRNVIGGIIGDLGIKRCVKGRKQMIGRVAKKRKLKPAVSVERITTDAVPETSKDNEDDESENAYSFENMLDDLEDEYEEQFWKNEEVENEEEKNIQVTKTLLRTFPTTPIYLPLASPSCAVIIDIKEKPDGTYPFKTYIQSADRYPMDVERTDTPPGFSKFTHTRIDGGDFTIEDVMHGGVSVRDLKANGAIGKFSVWYWDHDSDLSAPLFVEIEKSDNTYEYHASKGGNWQPVNGYEISNPVQLQGEPLEQALDDLNCLLNKAVTMDISKNASENNRNQKNGYCCDKNHSGRRVTVKRTQNRINSVDMEYYVHTIPNGGPRLTKIKYYYTDGNTKTRKNITTTGLNFPINGQVEVYIFYCGGIPAVIFVKNDETKGANKWCKREDRTIHTWKDVSGDLNNTTPEGIRDDRTCEGFKKLNEVLKGLGCTVKNCILSSTPGSTQGSSISVDSGSPGSYSQPQSLVQYPPQVTIKLKEKPPNGRPITYQANTTSGGKTTIEVTRSFYPTDQKSAANFYEYTHTLGPNGGSQPFILKEIKDDADQKIPGILEEGQDVTSVSAYYWTGNTNKVLIVEVVQDGDKYSYYTKFNGKWDKYNHIKETGKPSGAELDLLNCEVNDVVQIDVTKTDKDNGGGYCHDDNTDPKHYNGDQKKVRVKKVSDGGKLGNYKAYEHSPNPKTYSWIGPNNFNISSFKNGSNGAKLDAFNLPIRNVTRVVVYICEEGDKKIPLLIYYSVITDKVDGFNITHHWYKNAKPGNPTGSWVPTTGNDLSNTDGPDSYESILTELDKLTSKCKPPLVTIDISEKNTNSGYSSHDIPPEQINVVRTPGQTNGDPPVNYDIYKHTVESRLNSYFTLDGLVFKEGNTIAGIIFPQGSAMPDVTSVSVYYWQHLTNGKPLLMKIERAKNKSNPTGKKVVTWFENTGQDLNNNTKWTLVTEPSSVSELTGTIIRAKLDLLNCRLNNVVFLDISKQPESTYDVCEDTKFDPYHGYSRMKVEEHLGSKGKLETYLAYEHSLADTSSGLFHIFGIKSGPLGMHIGTLSGKGSANSPIIGVSRVIMYFCQKHPTKPLIIYYNNGGHNWLKDSGDGNWKYAGLSDIGPDSHGAILEALKTIDSICKPAPEGEAQALVVESTVAATSLWTAFGSTSGTLTGAGGLTGLGWWAFKRSRGDPWVRQI